jgi:exodeoxyribonuclease VII small subunit
MSRAEAEGLGFEEALAALEDRVRRIEAGEVPLEEALALYEQGVALAERCHDQLDAADERVAKLRHGARGIEEVPVPDRD